MQSFYKKCIFWTAVSGSIVLFTACAPESKYGGGNGSLKNYEAYDSYYDSSNYQKEYQPQRSKKSSSYDSQYEDEYRQPSRKTDSQSSSRQKPQKNNDYYQQNERYYDEYYESSKPKTSKKTKQDKYSSKQQIQTPIQESSNRESPVKGDGSFRPTKSLLDGMRESPAIQRATMRPYTIRGKTYYPHPVKVGDKFDGIASWYGPKFHARPTSNGETYNMHAHTAAHKTLPMNTIVKVYNKDNGKVTVVRINDRGPFVDGRIIDLSNVAAHDIAMVDTGIANVRIEVVGFGGDLQNNTPPKDGSDTRRANEKVSNNNQSRSLSTGVVDSPRENIRDNGYERRLREEQEAKEQALRDEIQKLRDEKEARERQENERRLKEEQERRELEEQERLRKEQEANEQALREQQEKEENERRLREEQEAKEQALRDEIQKLRDEKEARERQENERRLKEEQEAKEQALRDEIQKLRDEKEARERELQAENEEKLKALEEARAKNAELEQQLQDKMQDSKTSELDPNLGMREVELPKEPDNPNVRTIQQPDEETPKSKEEALESALTQIPPKRISHGDSLRDIDKAVQKLKDSTQDLAQRAQQENERRLKEEQERKELEEQERLRKEQEANEQALREQQEKEENERRLREEQEAKEQALRDEIQKLRDEKEARERQEQERRELEEQRAKQEQEIKELEEKLAKESAIGNYMISLNVFSQEERALRFKEDNLDKFEGTSYNLEVIPTAKGLYRVALRGFNDVAEAKEFMAEHGITGHVVAEEK